MFRCLPLAIGCYRYILVVHPTLVMSKPTLLRLVNVYHYVSNEFKTKKKTVPSSKCFPHQERCLVWLLVLLPLAACAANLPFVRSDHKLLTIIFAGTDTDIYWCKEYRIPNPPFDSSASRYKVCMTGELPV